MSSPPALPTLRDGEVTLRPLAGADLDRLVEIASAPGVREDLLAEELED